MRVIYDFRNGYIKILGVPGDGGGRYLDLGSVIIRNGSWQYECFGVFQIWNLDPMSPRSEEEIRGIVGDGLMDEIRVRLFERAL